MNQITDVGTLFTILDEKLIDLLKSLTPDEWNAQTVAKKWKVKDVAAHLLDNNIRALSLERDGYFGTEGPPAFDFNSLVVWLNKFNNDWVDAAKRISPSVMILLLEMTSKPTVEYLTSVDPEKKSVFPVDWAGESESKNWMHIARHYSERFLHQQQIRDAVDKPGIMTPELFRPFISTFMYALPHTYRDVEAIEGTAVKLIVSSEIGGSWTIEMIGKKWELLSDHSGDADAEVIMEPDIAWKLFSKSLRPHEIRTQVTINGRQQLGEVALNMVSVMA
jgi:uncharacterized protein (TIGR03083 family)